MKVNVGKIFALISFLSTPVELFFACCNAHRENLNKPTQLVFRHYACLQVAVLWRQNKQNVVLRGGVWRVQRNGRFIVWHLMSSREEQREICLTKCIIYCMYVERFKQISPDFMHCKGEELNFTLPPASRNIHTTTRCVCVCLCATMTANLGTHTHTYTYVYKVSCGPWRMCVGNHLLEI